MGHAFILLDNEVAIMIFCKVEKVVLNGYRCTCFMLVVTVTWYHMELEDATCIQ